MGWGMVVGMGIAGLVWHARSVPAAGKGRVHVIRKSVSRPFSKATTRFKQQSQPLGRHSQ
jgi:hypothetical protein